MADEDRIARVARALCVADGNDPEADFTVETYGEGGDGDRFHEVVAPTLDLLRWGSPASRGGHGRARSDHRVRAAVGDLQLIANYLVL